VSTSGGGGGAGAFPEPTPTNSLWNERLGGYIGNLGLTSPNGGMARSTSSTLDLNTGAGEVVNNGIVYIILGP
jgi:hypothetical protein